MHEQHRNLRAVSIAPRDAATDDHNERERIEQLDKRVATLRARAALLGWRCEVVAGGFECWKWSRCRRCESLDEAERFLASLVP